jgi:Cd2+/Zn2+-exporting ATPase
MNVLKAQFTDRAARKRLVLALAGALIVIAFVSGRMPGTESLRYPLMFAAAIIAGMDIARRAFDGLRRKQITIELLVTLAASGALIIGEVWEAAAVTFLFALGGWLEALTLGRTRRELSRLLDLAPDTAWVIRDDETIEVEPGDIRIGETVLVRPGDKVPVDGTVLRGHAAVDESAITGEPIPAEKVAGERVFAGTVSHDGVLYLEATGVGADTTLARIIFRVEEAQEAKAPAQQTIERFATWYTPAIIVLAIVTWIASRNVELALTLLVIGCPGALVIATPVAIVAGIGRAARRGILIKGGEYLETVGRVTAIAVDKTGTITEGKPTLTDVIAFQPALVPAGGGQSAAVPPETVLWWAAIAETGSAHPLARPILAAAQAAHDAAIPSPDSGETVPGQGVVANRDGHAIGVGTSRLMEDQGVWINGEMRNQFVILQQAGKTAMYVSVDNEAIGLLALTDVPRDSASALPGLLRGVGVHRLAMLTGDNEHSARTIAASVGIEEVHAGLLPEDKLAWIQRAQADGDVVAMVGDGINDAPALATANVGIAMGAAGSDIALETADVALMTDQLALIPEALRISRMAIGIIRQNLAIALATVGFLLAGMLLGRVDMAGGMLVHELSVLVVILNGMRLMRA